MEKRRNCSLGASSPLFHYFYLLLDFHVLCKNRIFTSRLAVIRDKRGRDNESQLYIQHSTKRRVEEQIKTRHNNCNDRRTNKEEVQQKKPTEKKMCLGRGLGRGKGGFKLFYEVCLPMLSHWKIVTMLGNIVWRVSSCMQFQSSRCTISFINRH